MFALSPGRDRYFSSASFGRRRFVNHYIATEAARCMPADLDKAVVVDGRLAEGLLDAWMDRCRVDMGV
eukprot:5344695-Heterocapsa_arctica.AAC.1